MTRDNSLNSKFPGWAHQDLWQLFLQVWGQAPADADLCLWRLGPRRGDWPHQICLSYQVSRDYPDPSLNKFSTSCVRIIEDENKFQTSTLLSFIIGTVCGVVTVSAAITFFILFRLNIRHYWHFNTERVFFRANKNKNPERSNTQYIKSGSLGMETPA